MQNVVVEFVVRKMCVRDHGRSVVTPSDSAPQQHKTMPLREYRTLLIMTVVEQIDINLRCIVLVLVVGSFIEQFVFDFCI